VQESKSTSIEKRNEKIQETQKFIQESIDKKYHVIKDCFDNNDKNDKTIITNFQGIATDLEEYFRLSYDDPAYQITMICEYIVKACKTRGFTDGQINYVYTALEPPQFHKYKRIIDVSSSHSLDSHRKRKEDSSVLFNLYRKKLTEAKAIAMKIGSMERDDHQDAMDLALDFVDDYTKELEANKIPVTRLKQHDMYESGKDESKDRITYPETIPAITELVHALNRYWQRWKKVAEIVEKEGIHKKLKDSEQLIEMISDEEIRKMAKAFDTVSELLDPPLDRKWRMDHLHWFKIVNIASEWFKHTGSTASKVQDFYGRWRSITREHVGARKDNMPKFFDKYVEMLPHYFLFFSIWMTKVRIRQGAEFSTDLSPKLSEQSMR